MNQVFGLPYGNAKRDIMAFVFAGNDLPDGTAGRCARRFQRQVLRAKGEQDAAVGGTVAKIY